MCGICGWVDLYGTAPPDRGVLEAMNAAMVHRGPDDDGLWMGASAALGMRRLSIIDVPGGGQPISNEDGSIQLVFNGEIYNFRTLRTELEKLGHRFTTQSDTEVVVHGYEEWGDDVLHRLNGMFAIAVYDVAQKRLLIARDRAGIKPLYYVERDGAFAFASELPALFPTGLVSGYLDAGALDAYFTYLYVPAPDTIFEGVKKLRPGEKIVVENGTVHREKYWRLTYRPDPSWTMGDAAEAASELVYEAVNEQMVSDVPIGALLSGGVDSSVVVAAMASRCNEPIQTFTMGFDDPAADERVYAEAVSQRFGTRHFEQELALDPEAVLGPIAAHFGEPFGDSSAVPTWRICEFARRHATVVLAGDGGDELFAGYTWLHMNRRVAQYRSAPESARRLVGAGLALLPGNPAVEKWRRFSSDSFLPPLESFRRRQSCFTADLRAGLFGPHLAGLVEARVIDRYAEHADRAAGLSNDDAMLQQDFAMYLPDDVLTKVDRMSMAHSLEVRVPLLDHRLAELAATLPFDLKYAGGESKRVLKAAFSDVLPSETLRQRKRGFAVPIQRWFRGPMRDFFKHMVLDKEGRSRELLNAGLVSRLLDLHDEKRENYGHHLWAVLMFEHWLRFVESAPGVTVNIREHSV